ncbi:MAG TPA: SRPBCC family protein [Gammaproteobacteria bacterium]
MSGRTSGRTGRVRGLAAFVALLAVGHARAAEPDLAWIDRTALEAGEVLVTAGKAGGSVTVSTASLIDAPAQAIWSVLRECEVAPEYVPNIVSCERLEEVDGGRAELFVQEIKPIFFVPRFEHVFRLDYYPYERIDVREVSGPLERMEGSWWFLPEPDGRILLVHHLEVDPGFPIPRFLLRATLRRNLVSIMEAVRERSEARAAR